MKKIIILLLSCWQAAAFAQSIAINNDGTAPNTSAMLDIKSTTKGMLLPRMTLAQRGAISTPATGLMIYQTDNTPGFYFYNGSSWIQFSTGSATNSWSQNGTHIYNNNTGNVGIGTSNPGTALHIARDLEALRFQGTTPYLSFFNTAGVYKGFVWQGPGDNMSIGVGSGNTTGRLEFYNNNIVNMSLNSTGLMELAGTAPWLKFYDNGILTGDIYGDTKNLELAAFKASTFGTPGHLVLQVSDVNQSQDLNAGNVGIGTRTPDFKLAVSSDLVQANDNTHVLKLKGRNPILSFNDENNNSYGYIKMWSHAPFSPYTNGLVIGASPGYPIFFSSNNYGVTMTVADNGNVGIGTTNPTYKLSVNGNIRSKEVVVETGWADYVFDEKYKLRPLTEVEKFIQQNKHLPNIPSAKEVEEKGLNLGDVQKRMMEKIEELTLYVIELKKEIEALKSKQ